MRRQWLNLLIAMGLLSVQVQSEKKDVIWKSREFVKEASQNFHPQDTTIEYATCVSEDGNFEEKLTALKTDASGCFGITPNQNRDKKKHFLSICSVFKNEAKFLKEWLEYHLLIGVDHFYLYNLESFDFFKTILGEYISRGIVTLIEWPNRVKDVDLFFESAQYYWPLSTQITAFENAVKYKALGETEWLVILDVNEFLVFPGVFKIKEVLEKYAEFPGLVLPCDYFDASAKNDFPKRKLLIETLELTKAPEYNPHYSVVKTIFKPEICHGFTWPPYKVQLKDQLHAIAISKREIRINHYVNRKDNLFSPRANIAYVDNRVLSDEEMKYIFESDYQIEDQDRAIYRFIPELLVRMSYDPISGW